MGLYKFGGTPPDEPLPPILPSQYGKQAYPTHCQWCKGETRIGRSAVIYCPRCDKTQDMVGVLPGREYRQRGDELNR